jgi:hypothetical protein
MVAGGASSGGVMKQYRTVFRLLLRLGVVAILTPVASTNGLAEASMTGPPDAVRLVVDQGSVKDVLDGLQGAYQVRYRSLTDLDDLVSGEYAGPLPQILSRLLASYDYILKTSEGTIDITIYRLNRASQPAAAAMLPPAVAAQSKTVSEPTEIIGRKRSKGAPTANSPVFGPVVAPWPPPPLPTQDPVFALLDRTARMQIPPSGTAPALTATGSGDANAAPNIIEMTRNASTALDGLKAALGRLPH